jgi:hypothetical protein
VSANTVGISSSRGKSCQSRASIYELKMPTLAVTNFNIVCSVLGGFITLFGLVSYLFKEKFYLSEACKPSSRLDTSFLSNWSL